jgi:hypothetical protein
MNTTGEVSLARRARAGDGLGVGTRTLAVLGWLWLAAAAGSAPAQDQVPAPAGPAAAEAEPNLDDYLANTPWSDKAYGLTLRPPLDTVLQHSNADNAILRIFKKERDAVAYTITLRVVKSTRDMDIPSMVDEALKQVGVVYPWAKVLRQRTDMTVSGHPAGVFYVVIAPEKGPRWVLGQGFFQITPSSYALLEIAINKREDYAAVQPAFEALLRSMSLQDPRQLEAERKQMLERGSAWIKTIDSKALNAVLVPEQLLRIVQSDKDVGFIKITQQRDKELGAAGIRVKVQTRLDLGGSAYDTVCWFFLADDGVLELWSVNTTVHPLGAAADAGAPGPGPGAGPGASNRAGPPTSAQWSEAGVRSGDKITVTREALTDKTSKGWDLRELGELPRSAYVTQVHTFLLQRLLPHDKPLEVAFYAYYVNSGKLSIRTERVVPEEGGGYTVYSRPGLDVAEEATRYDATGRMLERSLGEGRVVKPTTAAELQRIWGAR